MFSNCKSKNEDEPTIPIIPYKTDTVEQKVVINISDTLLKKELVLYVQEVANTSDSMNSRLHRIFNILIPEYAKKHGLVITGPRMAWYLTSSPPFRFQAGMPVNKMGPVEYPYNYKSIGGDSAIAAQFYGPYSGISVAYNALQDQIQSRKRKLSGAIYEIYVGSLYDSLGNKVNPYKVETDIIFPIKSLRP